MHKVPKECDRITSVVVTNIRRKKVFHGLFLDHKVQSGGLTFRVVTWYMGSGLKAQNMTGIRAQRRGLRAQKNGIRDHKAFEPKSGIRFITRSKNFLTQYFSA